MADKTIDTLIPDIRALFFGEGHKVSSENLDEFLDTIRRTMLEYLETPQTLSRSKSHRLSSLGTPDRKYWYDWQDSLAVGQEVELIEDPSANQAETVMRFLQGHLSEALLLFLAKEAGHTVEHAQAEVELEGIPGHPDAVIDGKLVDIKTTSAYSYSKFSKGKLLEQDEFGYVYQIAAYKEALGLEDEEVYFWAYNKSNSEMCLLPVPTNTLPDAAARARHVQELVNSPTVPGEKCYEDAPQSKTSPNRVLASPCRFCRHKKKCWADANGGQGLRVFQYTNKKEYFTEVNKTPTVLEITDDE